MQYTNTICCLSKDKATQNLNSLINQSSNQIVLNVNKSIVIVYGKIHIILETDLKGHSLQGSGSIIHPNGNNHKIPLPYIDSLITLLNNTELSKMGKLFYSQKKQSLEYRVNLKIKQIQSPSPQQIKIFYYAYKIYSQHFLRTLQKLGLGRKFSRRGLDLRGWSLELVGDVVDIVRDVCGDEEEMKRIKGGNMNRGSIVQQCDVISEIMETDISGAHKKTEKYKGQSFTVYKKKYNITNSETGQKIQKYLAVKSSNTTDSQTLSKFQRQNRIIRSIPDFHTFVKYYQQRSNKQVDNLHVQKKIYMEWCQKSILTEIYCYRRNIRDVIKYSKKLIQGVEILHDVGIVHRDLKPENILLLSQQNSPKELKIIDFGDSALIDANYQKANQILGYTLPYSPIECMILGEKGYNRKQIDLWSLGLLLYEITFQNIPLTSSKCFVADIYQGWKIQNQFQLFLNLQKHKGIRLIQHITSLICLHSVQIEQKNRLTISKIKRIYDKISKFCAKIE